MAISLGILTQHFQTNPFGPSKTVQFTAIFLRCHADFSRNGIPGKTVDVEFFQNPEYPLGNVQLELREGSVEQTNDLGFATRICKTQHNDT